MRVYFELMIRQFRTGLTYKFNYVCNLLSKMLAVFSQYFIWKALLSKQEIVTPVGNVGFQDMVTYTLISIFISTVINSNVILDLNDKIKTGQIALDIVKPLNYRRYLFFDSIGKNLYNVIYLLLPTMIISIALFGIKLPSAEYGFIFLTSLILGSVINFLLCLCLGSLGFWFNQLWILNRLVNDLLSLFSGKLIPLWFFPSLLLKLADCLPFKMVYSVPIYIFLEKYGQYEMMRMLLLQSIWIIILAGVSNIIWKKGMDKMVVQGG